MKWTFSQNHVAFTSSASLLNIRNRPISMSLTPMNGKDSHQSVNMPSAATRQGKPHPPSVLPKVQLRPELVGGLPLWLITEAMTQAQRLVHKFSQPTVIESRKKQISEMQSQLEHVQSSKTNQDIPVAKFLRNVADTVEEEMATLRQSRDRSKADAVQMRKVVEATQEEIENITKRYQPSQLDVKQRELQSTMEGLRVLLCREQTKSAAALKRINELEQALNKVKREKSQVDQDNVKLLILYTVILVMIFVSLSHSSTGITFVKQLTAGQS